MATPAPGTLVLFLGSDPALADRLGAQPAALLSMTRFFLPPSVVLGRAGRAAEAPGAEPGPFPPDQVMCAQRVLDRARRLRRTVRLVDVNRPGDLRSLVDRFVAADDVLPVLVRSDGARLVGRESFEGRTLRQFLAQP